jgi:type II secretory pathway predicted ATPase ExeA
VPQAVPAHLLASDGAQNIVVLVYEAKTLALSTLNVLQLLLSRQRHAAKARGVSAAS